MLNFRQDETTESILLIRWPVSLVKILQPQFGQPDENNLE